MILTNEEIKSLYKRTAIFYDRALLPYRLLGIDRHRRAVVRRLRLQPGDIVADLGCGTGANFPALIDAVGPEGRVVGFDLSGAMLDKAHERTARNQWKNVELFEADIRNCALPQDMAGAMSAFAMEMVPEYDAVVARIARCLPIGGRLGLLGMKHPEGWPDWLVDLGVWLNRPFGVSRDYAAIRPYEAVRNHMHEDEYREFHFGAVYRSIGERTR